MPRVISRLTVSLCASFAFVPLSLPTFAQNVPAVPTVPKGTGRPIGSAQVVPNPAYVLYNEAIQLTDAGFKAEKAGNKKAAHAKYEQARANYRKILQIENVTNAKAGTQMASGTAAIYANLALLSARENKSDALALMQKATVLAPKTGAFWQQLGAFQLQKQDWVGAAKSARKTLTVLPNDDTAQATLGIALMGQKKFVDALPILRKRKLLNNEKAPQADLRLLYGLAAANQKQEAAALAQKLATAYPDNKSVQQLAGDVAMQMGKEGDANKAFTRTYALAPKDLAAGLKAAIAAQSAGKYDEARKIAAKLASAYPDDPRPHFQLGYLMFYSPDAADTPNNPTHFQQAETEFRTATLASPKNPVYMTYLGLALLLQGATRHEEAGRILKSALSLDNAAPLAHLGMAKIAEQQNNWDAAINEYQTVLTNPKNTEFEDRARVGLAGVLYASGKKEGAYKQLELLSDKLPTDTSVLAQLASWLVKDSQIARAEATYQKIINRSGSSFAGADARVAIGNLMEKSGRINDAQKQYEQAVQASPLSANAALALGRVYLELKEPKEPQEAVKVYETLLKNAEGGKGDPTQTNMVRWQLASVFQTNLSKPNEALKQMQSMVIRNDDPNKLVYQLGPARLLISQSRFDEAIQNLQSLRAENPTEPALKYLLADAWEKSGKTSEAEALLRTLAASPETTGVTSAPKPDTTIALLALGGFYERNKKWDEAAQQYETVLRTDAARNEAAFGLARVRETQKKPEEAGAFFESLVFANTIEPNFSAISSAQRAYQQQSGQTAGPAYKALTQKVAAKYPKNPGALTVRVQVLMSGTERTPAERAEAADLLKRLLVLNPADAEANVQLGKLAEESDQKAEAIAYYGKAVQIDRQNAAAGMALRRLNAPFPGPPLVGGAPTTTKSPAPPAAASPDSLPSGRDSMVPRAPVPPVLPKGGK